jgi:hypothetical protein
VIYYILRETEGRRAARARTWEQEYYIILYYIILYYTILFYSKWYYTRPHLGGISYQLTSSSITSYCNQLHPRAPSAARNVASYHIIFYIPSSLYIMSRYSHALITYSNALITLLARSRHVTHNLSSRYSNALVTLLARSHHVSRTLSSRYSHALVCEKHHEAPQRIILQYIILYYIILYYIILYDAPSRSSSCRLSCHDKLRCGASYNITIHNMI